MNQRTSGTPAALSRGLSWDLVGLVLGPLAMIAWITSAPAETISPEAHRLAGIMILTIIWWLTEPIPIPATGILAVLLSVFLEAVPRPTTGQFQPAKIVLAPFADPSVYFLTGGMFLGRAMARHGLDRRFALTIITARWSGRSPGTVLASTGLSVMLVSMWISNTAATAMVYPVTMGIISVLATGSSLGAEEFARSRYASALLLMTAYASTAGGLATPIGTTTNVVAMGFFRGQDYFGRSADFARWAMVGVPLMLLTGAALFVWLWIQAPAKNLDLRGLRSYLREQRAMLGPWKAGERNALSVFLIVAGLWVAPAFLALFENDALRRWFSLHFPEEIVSLLAPVLLFLLPVDWRRRRFTLDADDFRQIDWGTLLLFGAGLSLGNLIFATGLAGAIAQQTIDYLQTDDVWAITAAAIVGGILLSEFTSNAATASTLIPVVWAICQKMEITSIAPLMGLTFAASFGSALPVATPPNAIVYGSRLLPAGRMVVAGLGYDLAAGVAIWCVLRLAISWGWSPFS